MIYLARLEWLERYRAQTLEYEHFDKYADACVYPMQGSDYWKGMCSSMQDVVYDMCACEWAGKMALNPNKSKDTWVCLTHSISEQPSI